MYTSRNKIVSKYVEKLLKYRIKNCNRPNYCRNHYAKFEIGNSNKLAFKIVCERTPHIFSPDICTQRWIKCLNNINCNSSFHLFLIFLFLFLQFLHELFIFAFRFTFAFSPNANQSKLKLSITGQRGRGHGAVYYTSPKNLIITLA